MPVDTPFNVYLDQLAALSHGLALWNPNPPKDIYDNVSIGDVGYLNEGTFIRMFNVMLEWDDPSNIRLGVPEFYKPMNCGPFANTVERDFDRVDHYSSYVSAETNAGNMQAITPDDAEGVMYTFWNHGALLSLPNGGRHKDAIRTKAFEDYIRDHVVSWYTWARNNNLGVERMEDLILVTGCTLVTSWAAAAFDETPANSSISLHAHKLDRGGAEFLWSNIRGNVEYHNSHFDPNDEKPLPQNQCVFIRGFRAKRAFRTEYPRALLPREDEIKVTQVPNASNYRDPLIGILDYIAEKCLEDNMAEDTIAIVHDDDLQLIEDVETLTADAIKNFLDDKQIPLLVENGVAIVWGPCDNEPPVSDEKAIFYAAAKLNGEPIPLVVHPVLTKYLLKLEMAESLDDDYHLPKEDLSSPAVHPPILSLKLENHQGYPQVIRVETSGDSRSTGVTVQDVLRTIHEDLRMPIKRREWSKLGAEERVVINDFYRERCKGEEKELGKGPLRMDFMYGKDRLQILPKHSPDGSVLLPTSTPTPA